MVGGNRLYVYTHNIRLNIQGMVVVGWVAHTVDLISMYLVAATSYQACGHQRMASVWSYIQHEHTIPALMHTYINTHAHMQEYIPMHAYTCA